MALDLLVFGANIVARHTTFPAGGLVESGEHVHGSGLACAVGPEETEDFAPFTLKEMSSTARKSPKALTRCSTSMTVSSEELLVGVWDECGRIEDVAKVP